MTGDRSNDSILDGSGNDPKNSTPLDDFTYARLPDDQVNRFDLSLVAEDVDRFTKDRDWDKYHSIRNLTLALIGEVGELAEILQWKSDDEVLALLESPSQRSLVEDEVADIAIYLVRICQQAAINLSYAMEKKLLINGRKYPTAQFRGSANKYTESGIG